MSKIKAPFVRNPYNYDMNEASDESGLKCMDPSLAQQQFKEESDINFIADRYGLTGELPTVQQLPTYGDFEGIFDFQSAQNAVRKSLEDFQTLPAKLRARFDNDPQKLLTFLENEDNRAEAEFMGLTLPKPPVNPPTEAAGSTPAGTKGGHPNPPETPPKGASTPSEPSPKN